jgi:hypothetical protein
MALSDRIYNKFEQWRQDVSKGFGGLLVTIVGKGIELTLDIVGAVLKPVMMPMIDNLLAEPDIPPEVKTVLTQIKTTDGQWQMIILGSLAGSMVGSSVGAVMMPPLEHAKQAVSAKDPFQPFDYQFVLAAWLRNINWGEDVFNDLKRRGWSAARIEVFKQLVSLRLDPEIVQRIWLRDKSTYEGLWQDLHDIGWDDERINVYKELAMILPSAQDLIRMAVREVFTPEIVEEYGQMEDFPPDFAAWGEKIGLTEQWAKNYWAAHWDLPSASQGFEMLHRGVITYDDLKVLLRALDVMPYWRDKLIEIAYSPYTRVDVRRMYKEEVLDEAGVKKAYLDLGYDEERATKLTEFTVKYYGRDETDVEAEQEKIRDLTRADVCDGYRKGILSASETTDLLSKLAYEPASIQFYIDREDLKKDQALKDAYSANYKRLYVTGIKDDEAVKSEMVDLGFLPGEVDELLRIWYTERIRREARPSRTDLARFLKKEIITEERWWAEMAAMGYDDRYIQWYRDDMEA